MIKVKGTFQYREEQVAIWITITQHDVRLPLALGPIRVSLSEWSRIKREFTGIGWEEIPSPNYQTQKEIGN